MEVQLRLAKHYLKELRKDIVEIIVEKKIRNRTFSVSKRSHENCAKPFNVDESDRRFFRLSLDCYDSLSTLLRKFHNYETRWSNRRCTKFAQPKQLNQFKETDFLSNASRFATINNVY